jgi:guanine nucleotide-binding protein subunit alpha
MHNEYSSQEARDAAVQLKGMQSMQMPTPAMAKLLSALIHDNAVDSLLEKCVTSDSAPYFLRNLDRIAEKDYCPTEQDVLHLRVKTSGVYAINFAMGPLNIRMIDVGGQRSQRGKWLPCFEEVTTLIFCVAISCYDQNLEEDPRQNQMRESLLLFESLVTSAWFVRSSIVLFLNKVDIFKVKLLHTPLKDYFPEYNGGTDMTTAAKFILDQFNNVNRQNLDLYPHLTQATDTANIRVVFAAVQATLIQSALRNTGAL